MIIYDKKKQAESALLGSGFFITCGKCGHIDRFERFTESELFGELPKGCYQCPHCNKAVAKVVDKTWINGFGQIQQDFKIIDIPRFL